MTEPNLKKNLKKNKHKINEFLLNDKILEDMFEHYKKLKHKWTPND